LEQGVVRNDVPTSFSTRFEDETPSRRANISL
jgi:hypothetical protein